MKIYFWSNPYDVDYGGSSVFAVAETLEEAKKIACSKDAINVSFGQYENSRDVTPEKMTLGDPTRVIEVPGAMWDYWSE